eukprot:TRINITY_DN16580_c0_g1_i9.p1 TRINITY_DN16580_c0_g1~~TRINITY_DN16580_c0_g1_i9.p1  ORF type:complete len:1088 (-),score=33.50 TRINITY_DN16580_c0_g1_i9:353-3616(-)
MSASRRRNTSTDVVGWPSFLAMVSMVQAVPPHGAPADTPTHISNVSDAPSANENGSSILLAAGEDDDLQQLDALYNLWKGLKCTEKRMDRHQCPTWARCDGGVVRKVDLSEAGCSGTVDVSSAIWSSLSRLEDFDLSINKITGELPVAFRQLRSLSHLKLRFNHLHGQLPAAWAELVSLHWLELDNNKLSGALPGEWGDLGNLTWLDISNNELTGALPASWSRLRSLRDLFLDRNQLCDQLPVEWAELRSLERLVLQTNNLQGQLPAAWAKLVSLDQLDLKNNKVSGALPGAWGDLGNLWNLDISNNELTGALPASWSRLRRLRNLYLERNQLCEQLPAEWAKLRSLQELFLQMNRFHGELPAKWAELVSLRWLDVSYNKVSGALPGEWGDLGNLLVLDISHNLLAGSIPAAWGNLSSLRGISASNNRLSGTLPVEFCNLTALGSLLVGQNRLTGSLPAEMSRMRALRYLVLDNNRFEGPFPNISDMAKLSYLVAHGNRLSGDLPRLRNDGNYVAVTLHSNRFHGRISDIGKPASLQMLLGLPGNYLVGRTSQLGVVSRAEPFIDESGWSATVHRSGPPRKTLVLLTAVFATWKLVRWRLPRTTVPRLCSIADMLLLDTFGTLRRAVVCQAFIAVTSAVVYSYLAPQFFELWDLNRYGSTLVKGGGLVFLLVSIPGSATFLLPTLLILPRHPSATPRTRFLRAEKLRVWTGTLAACLLTSLPGILNVYVQCSPSVPRAISSVKAFLPVIAAVLQGFVQPELLRFVARVSEIPLYKLQALQGASSWVLPLVATVLLSPGCYGAWWRFLEVCNEEVNLQCDYGHGAAGWRTYCRSNRSLDIVKEFGCHFENRTHCIRPLYASVETICGERWADPGSCTSSIIDIVGLFVFDKMCFACLLPLSLLLVSSCAQSHVPRWTPLGIVKTDSLDGVRVALQFQSGRLGVNKQLMALSSRFSPTQVMLRLSVSSDVALAWGLLYPPVAIAGLAQFLIEEWCYDVARNRLRFHQQLAQEVFQAPTYIMLAWYMVANIFGAVHVASALCDEPSWLVLALSLIVVTMSWIIGFRRSSGLVNASRSTQETLQLELSAQC